jgi:hypothetical protein
VVEVTEKGEIGALLHHALWQRYGNEDEVKKRVDQIYHVDPVLINDTVFA